MSHIVEIKTQVKDAAAVQAACRRLKLPEPQQRTVKLFIAAITGLVVQLSEWTYPIVCDTTTGEVNFHLSASGQSAAYPIRSQFKPCHQANHHESASLINPRP